MCDGVQLTQINSKPTGRENCTKRSEDVTCAVVVEQEEVTMRNVSVHPSSVENTRGDLKEGRDSSDGVDVFSKDAFAPLLTSNQYQVRKLAAQALMDVALMMANISQLRTLLSLTPDGTSTFYPMLALVTFSLMCQVVFAIFMFVILMRESDQQQKKDYLDNLKMLEANGVPTAKVRQSVTENMNDFRHQRVTTHLNYVTMVLVFLITVTNMFITGFGIKSEK